MDEWEVAAQQAAARWRDRDVVRTELRVVLLEMLKRKSMSDLAKITGLKRTTIYYIIYGRAGKLHDAA